MDWLAFDRSTREECRACPRFETGVFVPPKIGKPGHLALMAESPGRSEMEAPKPQPLIGRSGQLLNQTLQGTGTSRKEVTLTNCVLCGTYVCLSPKCEKRGQFVRVEDGACAECGETRLDAHPKPTPGEMVACAGLVQESVEGARVIGALGEYAIQRTLDARKVQKWWGSTTEAPAEVTLPRMKVLGPERLKSGQNGPRVECPECGFKKLGAAKSLKGECPQCRTPLRRVRGALKPRWVEPQVPGFPGRKLVLLAHPASVLRSGMVSLPLFSAHLRRAVRLAQGRPMVRVGGTLRTHLSDPRTLERILERTDRIVVDVETTRTNRMTMFGVAPDRDHGFVFHPRRRVLRVLAAWLDDPKHTLIAHNAPFDLHILALHGCPSRARVFDTMHAAQYERPDIRKKRQGDGANWNEWAALDAVASRIPNLDYYNWKNEFKEGKDVDEWIYCARDAATEYFLYEALARRLDKSNRLERFERVLMPLLLILDKMERDGIRLHLERAEKITQRMERVEAALLDAWARLVPRVNPRSSKARLNYFYDELKLKPRFTGFGSNRRRTLNREALETLASEYPECEPLQILAHFNHATKIRAYIEAWTKAGDRAHFAYNLSGTETGRLSGDGQQVKRPGSACSVGVRGCVCHRLRSIFIGDQGHECLGVADYSQIESRLVALLAGERWLIDAFERTDFDFHTETAERLKHAGASKFERSHGKMANHALDRVMGAGGIARKFGVGHDEAHRIVNALRKARPATVRWWDRLQREVEEHGFLTTPYGRRGYFKPDSNGEYKITQLASFPPQSCAGDHIYDAMLRAHEAGLTLRLQAHDELVVSLESKEQIQTLVEVMETDSATLNWWCPVEAGTGNSWEKGKLNAR